MVRAAKSKIAQKEKNDLLYRAILTLKNEEECYSFFQDLFTFSGIVVLTLVKNEWQAVIAVVLLSVSVCLNGFIQPLLAAEIFGRSAYNTTLGIMMAMLSVGGLLSSPLVNFSFDATGSYTRILIVLAVIAAVDALFLLPAFHAEAKYRRELETSGQLSDAGPET